MLKKASIGVALAVLFSLNTNAAPLPTTPASSPVQGNEKKPSSSELFEFANNFFAVGVSSAWKQAHGSFESGTNNLDQHDYHSGTMPGINASFSYQSGYFYGYFKTSYENGDSHNFFSNDRSTNLRLGGVIQLPSHMQLVPYLSYHSFTNDYFRSNQIGLGTQLDYLVNNILILSTHISAEGSSAIFTDSSHYEIGVSVAYALTTPWSILGFAKYEKQHYKETFLSTVDFNSSSTEVGLGLAYYY